MDTFFQTLDTVVYTQYGEGFTTENVIKLNKDTISVNLNGQEKNFDFPHAVNPREPVIKIYKTKVELVWKKATEIHWESFNKTQSSVKKSKNKWETELCINDVDDDNKDSLEVFFKDLYKNGTDDMKKAMNKSFVESNGTKLSTNLD